MNADLNLDAFSVSRVRLINAEFACICKIVDHFLHEHSKIACVLRMLAGRFDCPSNAKPGGLNGLHLGNMTHVSKTVKDTKRLVKSCDNVFVRILLHVLGIIDGICENHSGVAVVFGDLLKSLRRSRQGSGTNHWLAVAKTG